MNEMNQDFYLCVARDRFERIRAEMEWAKLRRESGTAARPWQGIAGRTLAAVGRWIGGPVPDWTGKLRLPAPATVKTRAR